MSGEKTQKPTPKKLRDARKKGQVAVSKDTGVVVKLSAFYLFFFWAGGWFVEQFSELVESIVKHGLTQGSSYSQPLLDDALEVFLLLTIPIALLCAIAGLISTWMQTGMIVSPEAATYARLLNSDRRSRKARRGNRRDLQRTLITGQQGKPQYFRGLCPQSNQFW